MIKVIDGDLLNAPEKYIVHQVNCKGVMGAGVARQVKEKYPEVFMVYKSLTNRHRDNSFKLLGKALLAVANDGKRFWNVFGEDNYGHTGLYTKYDDLENGLHAVFQNSKGDVAIPYKIGCGYGGGDWNIVYSMIEKLSKNFEYDVILYRYNK